MREFLRNCPAGAAELDPCLSMIFSENRYPLFRIMLWTGN
jgi:hypothetical protein